MRAIMFIRRRPVVFQPLKGCQRTGILMIWPAKIRLGLAISGLTSRISRTVILKRAAIIYNDSPGLTAYLKILGAPGSHSATLYN